MCIYVSILQVFPPFSYTLEIQISQMFLMTLEELLYLAWLQILKIKSRSKSLANHSKDLEILPMYIGSVYNDLS